MNNKLARLFNKSFVRNIIIMSTGTIAAQAISLLLTPIITRIYGPESYGLMGVFIAIMGVVTPIAALTYPIAIVLPKKNKEAQSLAQLSIYISIGLAILVLLILCFFKQFIVRLFNIEEISPYLFLIPVVILCAGFFQVMEQWLIRTKQFGISAKVAFSQSLLVNGAKTGLGYLHPFATTLIILSSINEGIRAIMMLVFSKKTGKPLPFQFTKLLSLKTTAKKYEDFPLFRAPQVLLNAFSDNMPVLLLSVFFGPASAGFYTLCRSVLKVPSNLIGKSIGDVFYPRISEAKNNGENLTKLIRKAILLLGAVGIIPFGVIVAFGPWLFTFIFGAGWEVAGEYARWISLWMFFNFTYQPCIRALPVLSAQGFHLIFTVLTLLVQTSNIIIGYYIFSSDLVIIALFGSSGAILCIVLILITLRISKKVGCS
ncbi:colanic acid exporter [Oceanobacillus picturae]|uniref:Colanic acid exporter n=1 Tax=Oceanobacillus picturae TaxID=171693 RepID=W9BB77_9BACI|nr:oligosaccharide flippase family protein [Oceanobacillus picturae]CDO03670.1 colanic acid exporter [Oceanobacillus picturae]